MIGRARRAPAAAGLRWCSVTGDLSTGGAAPSVFPALEALLPRVAKPVQYVGGELNARAKAWDAVQVRWALMYPDAYEVGLPNQGVQILYEMLNERPDALAERCYAVWPDLEALMREHGVPAFTVDGHRPMGAFDVLGVSFSTELGYTNLLTALDLAGIPLHAADRDEHHPIVVAGGHAAFNPEPIADFVDAAAIGDGEEVVGDITDVVRDWKAARPPGRPSRAAAAARGGPGLLRAVALRRDLRPGRRDRRGAARRPGASRARCTKRTTVDLDSWPYPKAPLVPMAETVHERASVEIFRGCTRGCRFCQAGMITRPVRERSLRGIGEMVDSAVRASGFDEVGLLSLSSADHSEIAEITKGLADRYEGTNTSLSLPTTRVDAFNIDLANEISRNGRRSGLTFAPEGGSERIRRVINKMVSEDDLIRTVSEAFAQGWRQVKLYFMCGLPTEEDADVVQIADMAHNVIRAGRAASGRNDVRCTVSIGGFVPKPHTPFQWAAQAHPDVVDGRLRKLRAAVNADRKLGRNVGMRYHDGQPSLIEGLLARGDRRVGAVIERVWRDGGRFDGWSEHFSYERWATAAPPSCCSGVTLEWFTTRERDARRGAARGTTSTPGWSATGCGTTGRTPSPAASRTTAAGRRASTAACARRPAPRSRSGRAARRCCRSPANSRAGPVADGRDFSVRVADERDMPALARLRRGVAGGTRRAPGRRARLRGGVRRVVARRAAAAHVLAGRGRLGAQRVHRDRLDQRRRDRAHAPPGAAAAAGSGTSATRSCSASFADRGVPAALLARAVSSTRGSGATAPGAGPDRGQQRAFYRRAGFLPAGESLLVLDPMALPDPTAAPG